MSLPSKFFLASTDYGIGKTVAAALLCNAGSYEYWQPIAVKREGTSDTKTVAQLGRVKTHSPTVTLSSPTDPHLAARSDGVSISLEDFRLPEAERLIVEGIGGLALPINASPLIWQTDLIAALELPAVLVASTQPRSLHHLVANLTVLAALEIPCAGVLLAGPGNPHYQTDIPYLTGVRVVAHIPKVADILEGFNGLAMLVATQLGWMGGH